ncbi:MAG: hypothetical protein ACRD3B_07585 [Candidatus Sulfotelmatobacter sp.]
MAALMMTVFGFIWLGWGFSASSAFTDFSSGSILPATRWISFYAVFLVLLGISIQAVRRSAARMKTAHVSASGFRSRYSRPFKKISFFEGAGCILAVALTVLFHRMDLLAFGISLVVGLHFLPLARLFRFPAYYVAGGAIILTDPIAVAMLRDKAIAMGSAVGAGIVLWLTGMYTLQRGREFLKPGPR